MFESGILDVAIGLAFVFLLFSLMVTAASEMLASALRWRATFLWRGIEQLLQSPAARDAIYGHPLIKGLTRMGPAAHDWKHGRNGPSYIPSRTFALALIDIIRRPHQAVERAAADLEQILAAAAADPATTSEQLARAIDRLAERALPDDYRSALSRLKQQVLAPGDAGPDQRSGSERAIAAVKAFSAAQAGRWLESESEPLRQLLRPLLEDSAHDVDRFRENIEIWFNDGMDRVSGWYKRHTGVAQFAIALSLSVVLNVDALMIVRTLWREPAIRQSIVSQATSVVQTPSASLVPPAVEQRGAGPDPIVVTLASPTVDAGKLLTVYLSVPPDVADRIVHVERASALIRLRQSAASRDESALDLAVTAGQASTQFFVAALDTATDSRERLKISASGRSTDADLVVRPAADRRFDDIRSQISGLGLPIGWRECDPRETLAGTSYFWCALEPGQPNYLVYWVLGIVSVGLGWLLTAAAAALGAPFWFDTLKRFVNVRSTGKAPEERPLPPKEVSQPREPGQRPDQADLLGALRKG